MADIKQSKSVWWRIKKIGIGIGLVFYLYPFYCLALNQWPGWDLGKLYTFGLELKEFMTAWIALGGVMAVVIGIFQTQRRITKQEEQFKEQINTQQKQQRDARFAAGVELLGNPHESTRIGGAYNLYFLARDFEEYRTPVCEILCAHIRTITNDLDYQNKYKTKPSNEVQTIMDLLLVRQEQEGSIFKDRWKDLNSIFLSGFCLGFKKVKEMNLVVFSNAIINNIDFESVKLNHVWFEGSVLTNIKFWATKFNWVSFKKGTLSNNDFGDSKLNYVDFGGAELTDCNFLSAELNVVSFSICPDSIYKDGKFYSNTKHSKLYNVTFSGAKEFKHVDFSMAKLIDPVNFSLTPLQGFSCKKISEPNFSLVQTKGEDEASMSINIPAPQTHRHPIRLNFPL